MPDMDTRFLAVQKDAKTWSIYETNAQHTADVPSIFVDKFFIDALTTPAKQTGRSDAWCIARGSKHQIQKQIKQDLKDGILVRNTALESFGKEFGITF